MLGVEDYECMMLAARLRSFSSMLSFAGGRKGAEGCCSRLSSVVPRQCQWYEARQGRVSALVHQPRNSELCPGVKVPLVVQQLFRDSSRADFCNSADRLSAARDKSHASC